MKAFLLFFGLLSTCLVGCATQNPKSDSAAASPDAALAPQVHLVLEGPGPKDCTYLTDFSLDTADENFQKWLKAVTAQEGGNYFVVDKMWLDGQIYLCPEQGKNEKPAIKTKQGKKKQKRN